MSISVRRAEDSLAQAALRCVRSGKGPPRTRILPAGLREPNHEPDVPPIDSTAEMPTAPQAQSSC